MHSFDFFDVTLSRFHRAYSSCRAARDRAGWRKEIFVFDGELLRPRVHSRLKVDEAATDAQAVGELVGSDEAVVGNLEVGRGKNVLGALRGRLEVRGRLASPDPHQPAHFFGPVQVAVFLEHFRQSLVHHRRHSSRTPDAHVDENR